MTDQGALDPVVAAALADVTTFVCRRRRVQSLILERRDRSMRDPQARDVAIHVFRHLAHGGYEFNPSAVRNWARSHGWPDGDAWLLSDYALGVASGLRYHTGPDPFGSTRGALDRWRNPASGSGEARWTGRRGSSEGTRPSRLSYSWWRQRS